jgi:hypothetical protein
MPRRLSAAVLSALIVAVLSLSAAVAQAADFSWQTSSTDTYSTVSLATRLSVAWTDKTGCGGGQILFHYRASSWSPTQTVVKCRSGVTITSAPVLTYDAQTHAYVIVWSQSDFSNSKLDSVQEAVSRNGGLSWALAHKLLSTTSDTEPMVFAAAARGGAVWLAYPTDKGTTVTGSVPFSLSAFSEAKGTGITSSLTAEHRGTYVFNDSSGDLGLWSTQGGLVLAWEISNIAGTQRIFVADTGAGAKPKRTVLSFRGQIPPPSGPAASLIFGLGENDRLYMVEEAKEKPIDIRLTIEGWSASGHQFEAIQKGVVVIGFPSNATLPRAALAVGADPSDNIYLSYIDYSNANQSCILIVGQPWPCTIATAPGPIPSDEFVFEVTPSGQQSQAQIPYPVTATKPAGDNMVEWAQSGSGVEAITTAYGGVSSEMLEGWQDITATGSEIGQEANYVVDFSEPLSFGPFQPDSLL